MKKKNTIKDENTNSPLPFHMPSNVIFLRSESRPAREIQCITI